MDLSSCDGHVQEDPFGTDLLAGWHTDHCACGRFRGAGTQSHTVQRQRNGQESQGQSRIPHQIYTQREINTHRYYVGND